MAFKNKKAHRTRSQAKREETLEQKSLGLYKAVAARDVERAKQWLQAGAIADLIHLDNNMSYTPFHAALPEYNNSGHGDEEESNVHIELLNLLVDPQHNTRDVSDINIFSPDSNGMNPFEWACADGHHECVQWFLQRLEEFHDPSFAGTIINRINEFPTTLPSRDVKRIKGQTPIHLAIRSESSLTVKHLCRFETKPNIRLRTEQTLNAIHIAVQQNVPKILRYILTIATVDDIKHLQYKTMTPLQHAQHIYEYNLTHAVLPSAITKSWQCVQLIKDKLENTGKLTISTINDPSFNAVLQFWHQDSKNPNTNIYHQRVPPPRSCGAFIHHDTHPIHRDVRKLIQQEPSAKYVAITFEQAVQKQHESPFYAATYRGALNASERYLQKQKLSPFAQQFKQCLHMRKQLLNESHDAADAIDIDASSDTMSVAETTPTPSVCLPDDATDNYNHNHNHCIGLFKYNANGGGGKRKKEQRVSLPTFCYQNETVTVVANNPHLERELSSEDRVRLYEMSIGINSSNDKVQIMEILDPAHPAKRYNLEAPVFGLFCTTAIKKQEFILEYAGLLQSSNEYDAELNEYERFDAQHRVHELETYAQNSKVNRLYVNASYFSNECVFVNDATFDDVYGRWSKQNASFFEIVINGWPHMFLRCFIDIEVGDELLTYYGKRFWDQYKKDCKISRNLYAYHLYRKEREENSIANVNVNVSSSRKRQRNTCSDDHHVDKKRKIAVVQKRLSIEEQSGFHHPSLAIEEKIDEKMLQLMENDDSTIAQLLRLQIQKNEMLTKLLRQQQMNEQRKEEKQMECVRELKRKMQKMREKLQRFMATAKHKSDR